MLLGWSKNFRLTLLTQLASFLITHGLGSLLIISFFEYLVVILIFGFLKSRELSWRQDPKNIFFLVIQIEQRDTNCGILTTAKLLLPEILCLRKIHCRKGKYSQIQLMKGLKLNLFEIFKMCE